MNNTQYYYQYKFDNDRLNRETEWKIIVCSVNENFIASHPTFGFITGNFNKEIHATSVEGYNDFTSNYHPALNS